MKKLDKRLLRMIKNSRGQYIAILTIVIAGLLIFTSMNNAYTNIKTTLDNFYDYSNFADANVLLTNIPDNVSSKLIGKYSINQAESRIVVDVPFISENIDERVTTRIISVDSKENLINKLYMKDGTRAIEGREVIVIEQFAIARNINIGDKIKLQINGRQYDFKVKGIASSPEFVYLMENEQNLLPMPDKFGVIFLEKTYAKKIISSNGNYNELLFKLDKNIDIDKTLDNIKEELEKYGVRRTIKKENQISNSIISQKIGGMKKMSQSLPIMFLIVAGIILAAMVNRTVKKDRIAIGILKALGYTNADIMLHYIKYSISIGIIGGLIGTISGTIFSGFITHMYIQYFNIPMLQIRIYPVFIVSSIILSSIFCVLTGLVGTKDILGISPSESMRPEAPKKGKRIALERVKIIWSRFSFTWKIVIRNIFREKKKFIFISLAAALTFSMMIVTFWMGDIYSALFGEHYSEFMKMDYIVNFSSPTNENAINELRKLIDSDIIEPKVEFPFELKNGRKSKIVNIIGLEKDTAFYGFKDLSGNEINIPSTGMLISSNLASALKVNKKDKIQIHSFIPDRDDVYVEVAEIIDQKLGINGYMHINYYNELLTEKNMVSGAYVSSENNITEQLKNVKKISSIQSQKDLKDMFYEFTDLIMVAISVMIIFSGILGFVIIYSMSIMSINERILEFSSLRVLGFTKIDIFKIIIKENTIMAIIGLIYGLPMGLSLVNNIGNYFSTDLYTFNGPVTLANLINALVFTIICLVFAQLITYKKIKSLDFIQALKNRIS